MCFLSEAGDILPEGKEETWQEAHHEQDVACEEPEGEEEEAWEGEDGEEVAGGEASGAPEGGGGEGHASGVDDGGGTRFLNNPKGDAELEAIMKLGFPLDYTWHFTGVGGVRLTEKRRVTAGLRLFKANTIQEKDLVKYGLVAIWDRKWNKAPPPLPTPLPVSLCACLHRCGLCACLDELENALRQERMADSADVAGC